MRPAFALFLVFSSFSVLTTAASYKQEVIFFCESAEPYPDKVIQVTVFDGGPSIFSHMVFEESLAWGSRTTDYIIINSHMDIKNQIFVYVAKKAALTIQMNDVDEQGRHPALFVKSNSSSKGQQQVEALNCSRKAN